MITYVFNFRFLFRELLRHDFEKAFSDTADPRGILIGEFLDQGIRAEMSA